MVWELEIGKPAADDEIRTHGLALRLKCIVGRARSGGGERPGARLPDLTISDHTGQPVTLSKVANGFPLILSFYRGYW